MSGNASSCAVEMYWSWSIVKENVLGLTILENRTFFSPLRSSMYDYVLC